jgi:hypothetical protein
MPGSRSVVLSQYEQFPVVYHFEFRLIFLKLTKS